MADGYFYKYFSKNIFMNKMVLFSLQHDDNKVYDDQEKPCDTELPKYPRRWWQMADLMVQIAINLQKYIK